MSSQPLSRTCRRAADELAQRHQALSHPSVFEKNPLLARQEAHESNARSYPRRIPLAMLFWKSAKLWNVQTP